MRFYFVRHAESVANANLKKIYGAGDQLSPRGNVQAIRLAESLLRYSFDQIYSSPSLRALQTVAPYLRSAKRRATVLPTCSEIPTQSSEKEGGIHGECCEWDERKHKKIDIPEEYRELFALHGMFTTPTLRHESWGEAMQRVDLLLDYFTKWYGGSSLAVLLVSHGRLGRELLSRLVGGRVEHPSNAGVWELSGTSVPFSVDSTCPREDFPMERSPVL